ncbi:MAG: M3 family metallopeptidase [Flavobacteriales bacterium]|jgi:peptidyl-dipeptidase Dcp|nr:M3 family metallopeptidase [Flavobacteriales bacterium]
MNNPFLQPYTAPLEAIPFDKIELVHFKTAFEEGIKEGKKEIEKIKQCPPSFSNTIEALEQAGQLLNKVSSVFFNLNSANTSDEMQQLAQEVSPMLTAYSSEISLDEALFNAVKMVFENTNKQELTQEQAYLLEKTYKGFVRNGANLKPEEKEELKEINTKLAQLTLTFSENVMKDAMEFELHLTNEDDLKGLPDGIKEAAALLSKSKGKTDGWLFTLDYPSYIPFMKYAENRTLRKQLNEAFGARGFNKNNYNNENTIAEIVALRLKKAQLLGYHTYADFVLEERMAKSPTKVYQLWDELLEVALPKATEELNEIKSYAQKLGFNEQLEAWDFSYYAEQLKNEKFAINDEILKPYFKLENVLEGAFKVANKLFDITFHQREDIPLYHEDVVTYEVKDNNNNFIALFYADFFPREGKRSGAWMTSFRGQNKYNNSNQRPFVSIVCNFTKPTETKPSLLTFNEVTTLFHEFGHALHGMLADGYYESLSGTSVFWDFVELPSQLMENWCYEEESLNLFAKHYQTNEAIPMEFVQKIKDSAQYLSAYQTVRQTSLGQLDMAWHNLNKAPEISVSEFEKNAGEKTQLFPYNEKTNTSAAFSHIFAGGYAAGYYSYKWAEVLEADAFDFFLEKGIFNKAVATSYKDNILSKGGSKHPMELYKQFRGAVPSTKALLKKAGLI